MKVTAHFFAILLTSFWFNLIFRILWYSFLYRFYYIKNTNGLFCVCLFHIDEYNLNPGLEWDDEFAGRTSSPSWFMRAYFCSCILHSRFRMKLKVSFGRVDLLENYLYDFNVNFGVHHSLRWWCHYFHIADFLKFLILDKSGVVICKRFYGCFKILEWFKDCLALMVIV